MRFQASDSKENNFLDLVDNDFNTIEPSYIKGGPWLQAFGHSNYLCARATRAITNHVPELLELSQIMRQLGNTTSGSFQMNSLVVHATTTLLRPEGIYFMNAKDSMSTGTLGEIC